jgi:hypothetical protein
MNGRIYLQCVSGLPRRAAALLWAALACAAATAAEPPGVPAAGPEPRAECGRCTSDAGTLLTRRAAGADWQPAAAKDAVYTRDQLMALPGVKAVVETPGVTLTLWGNVRQLSAFPGLESAVVLHDGRAFDLDFTVLTGRVLLTNAQKKGPARVWLRLPGGESWQVVIGEPGDQAAVEVYGRWPRGTSFVKDPKPGDEPTYAAVLLAIKGQTELTTEAHSYLLTAPPGPAVYSWDSAGGEEGGPRQRKALPPWADPKAAVPAEGKTLEDAVDLYQKNLKAFKSPQAAMAAVLDAADKEADKPKAAFLRDFAVAGLGALDQPRVAELLADPHSADVREAAVLAARHWIGKSADRDLLVYHHLTDRLGYTPREAETVMQLLHNPFDPDQPETYEVLIRGLDSKKLAVRELSRWHLYRLTPVGKDISYDAAAPDAERDKAVKAWQELIPAGKLPKEKKPG